MKNLLFILIYSFSFAQGLTFNFDKVPLPQFIQGTYGAVLKSRFVIDPRLTEDNRKITLQVDQVTIDKMPAFLESVLNHSDIAVKQIGGIYFIGPKVDNIEQQPVKLNASAGQGVDFGSAPLQQSFTEFSVYRPRYRSHDYLQKAVNQAFGLNHAAPDVVIYPVGLKAESLLISLDTKPPELTLNAAIIEYSDENTKGGSWAFGLTALSSSISKVADNLQVSSGQLSLRAGGLSLLLASIDGDSRFKLVSKPSLRLLSGAQGRLIVGTDTPVLDALQLDKNGNLVKSVSYRQSGVIFDVMPNVYRDQIRLDITQQLSNFQATTTSDIGSPTLTKREVKTSLSCVPGEVVVLAGMEQTKDSSGHGGFAWLPDWARSSSKSTIQSQIVLAIQCDVLK